MKWSGSPYAGAASALLLLYGGCEEGRWDWETGIATRPLRCCSSLFVNVWASLPVDV